MPRTDRATDWGLTAHDREASARLSAHVHRRKEQILTQPEPAKVRETASAIVAALKRRGS